MTAEPRAVNDGAGAAAFRGSRQRSRAAYSARTMITEVNPLGAKLV